MSHVFKVGDGQSFRVKLDFYPLFGIASKQVQPANYELPNGDLIWSGVIDGKAGTDGWINSLSDDGKTITMKNEDITLFDDRMAKGDKRGFENALSVIFMKSSQSSDYVFLGTFRYVAGSRSNGQLMLERVGDEYTT